MAELVGGPADGLVVRGPLTVWVCSECGRQVEPPGHGDYSRPGVAGHYHDPDGDSEGEDPWFDAVEIEVVPDA